LLKLNKGAGGSRLEEGKEREKYEKEFFKQQPSELDPN
jgi:hypothetical protein